MRKKFVNVALFGALLVASLSLTTSCKDYDDDIANLQGQIDQNATDLEGLVNEKISTLSAQVSDLDSQHDALDAQLQDAKSKWEAAKSELEAAIAAAQSAAQSDAEAYAKAQAEAAKAYAAEQAAAAQEAAIAAAQKAIEEARATLQAGIDAANASIEAANESIGAANGRIDALVEAEGELQTAIAEANGEIQAAKDLAQTAQTLAEAAQDAADNAQDTADKNAAKIAEVVENLQGINEDLSGQITILDQKISEALAEISKNKTEIEGKLDVVKKLEQVDSAAIAELQGKVGDLQKTDSTLLGKIEKNTEALEAMGEQLGALQETMQNEIDAAKAEVGAQVEAVKAALGKDIQSVRDSLAAAYDSIEGTKSRMKELEARIQSLENIGGGGDDGGLSDVVTEALENIEAIQGNVGKLQSSVEELQGSVEKNTTDIAELRSALARLDLVNALRHAEIATKLAALDTRLSTICNALSKQLKALVFSPEVYYQGIEAIGVYSYYYDVYKELTAADVTKDQTGLNEPQKVTPTNTTEVIPNVKASYYMNPANSNVDTTDMSHYSFIVNNATLMRSVEKNQISVIRAEKSETTPGLLNVYFKMELQDGDNGIEGGNDKVDVAALQYTYEDRMNNNEQVVVTSDFAALKSFAARDFAINKVGSFGAVATGLNNAGGDHHLAGKAADAVAVPDPDPLKPYPRLQITYNNKDTGDPQYDVNAESGNGLDLDNWINVHYKLNGGNDQVWGGQDELNDCNFELQYELIGYIKNDATKTNESAHATITGTVLTVHEIGGNNTSRKIIGRTPLIRVKLVDRTNKNQIAAVGYILVDIVDDVNPNAVVVDGIDPVTENYTVTCDVDTKVLNGQIVATWQQIEDLILGNQELDMSHEEFAALYSLEMDALGLNAKQYKSADGGKTFEEVPIIDAFGTVTLTTESSGNETRVFKWTVNNQEAYNKFVTDKETSVEVYVKLVGIGQRDIYVKLTWKPEERNIAPKIDLNAEGVKAKSAWYEKDKTATQGLDEVHVQANKATVAESQLGPVNVEYTYTLDDAFSNGGLEGAVRKSLENPYEELSAQTEATYKFAPAEDQKYYDKFTGLSGTKYALTVTEDGTQIKGDKIGSNNRPSGSPQTLATIDPATGKITLEDNEFVKDILNAQTKWDATNDALTFTVTTEYETCDPAERGGLLSVENETFDVKYLKPVYVGAGKMDEVTLNDNSTMKRDVKLNFNDFNNYTPGPSSWDKKGSSLTFYEFYGVTKIELNTQASGSGIETDYSGTFAPVNTNQFTVDYTAPTDNPVVDGKFGSVTFNQGANFTASQKFQVRLHLLVTYVYGQLPVDVDFTVNPSPQGGGN